MRLACAGRIFFAFNRIILICLGLIIFIYILLFSASTVYHSYINFFMLMNWYVRMKTDKVLNIC